MKAKSPHYARIRADVLAIAAHVPRGALLTFAEVGGHLDVMARHVAYILSRLDQHERDRLPWYRIVPLDGRVARPAQRAALEAEGFAFDPDGRVAGFPVQVVDVRSLKHGVLPQKRPT
jgi:methylated-DNA-protein-cysteine methyltransferase related protein